MGREAGIKGHRHHMGQDGSGSWNSPLPLYTGAGKGGTRASSRRGEGQAEKPFEGDEKKARDGNSGQGVSKGC